MRFQPRTALIYAILILAISVPRLSALDRFVTVDEPKWLARAGNFYLALAQGDLVNTFTREHPGVTVTWAGTVGLLWRYPEYVNNVPGYLDDSRQVEPLIREHGLEPIKVLAAARVVMVMLVIIALVGSFWASSQLIGLWPSFLGFMFVAFDPFYLGLSRLLHLDGLMSSLLLLSLLAFLNYRQTHSPRKNTSLVISAVAAGLAWLTKSPALFLIPFLGLITILDIVRAWYLHRRVSLAELWRQGRALALWFGLGALVFVLLWPAMWVDPLGALQQVFSEATAYAEEGHSSDVFFKGAVISGDPGRTYSEAEQTLYGPWAKIRVTGDEGRSFYLIAYLWRATPLVLLGLILAALAFFLRVPPRRLGAVQSKKIPDNYHRERSELDAVQSKRNPTGCHCERSEAISKSPGSPATGQTSTSSAMSSVRPQVERSPRRFVFILVLFAALFAAFMTFGSKKFDRYLSPVFPPLDLVAAAGWVMAARWVGSRINSRTTRLVVPVALGSVVLLQAVSALQTHPYYLTYYNPILGGGQVAPQVMMVGWGEGLDQAARYLNAQPNASKMQVLSWYPDGPFSYIFDGQTLHAASEWGPTREQILSSDFVVLYIHQWQRQLPFSEMLAYFSGRMPEHVIRLDGIDYAQIYRIQDATQR